MKVYITTMTAISDHGTAGVFTTLEAAQQHARAVYADSDKHHEIRIDEVTLDEPHWPAWRGRFPSIYQPEHPDSEPLRSWMVPEEWP